MMLALTAHLRSDRVILITRVFSSESAR